VTHVATIHARRASGPDRPNGCRCCWIVRRQAARPAASRPGCVRPGCAAARSRSRMSTTAWRAGSIKLEGGREGTRRLGTAVQRQTIDTPPRDSLSRSMDAPAGTPCAPRSRVGRRPEAHRMAPWPNTTVQLTRPWHRGKPGRPCGNGLLASPSGNRSQRVRLSSWGLTRLRQHYPPNRTRSPVAGATEVGLMGSGR
jgi:hypothetical protein